MRGILSPLAKGQPWFEAKSYRLNRIAIAKRVARKAEAAHRRATIRRAYAKKHDVPLHSVTNAMCGL